MNLMISHYPLCDVAMQSYAISPPAGGEEGNSALRCHGDLIPGNAGK